MCSHFASFTNPSDKEKLREIDLLTCWAIPWSTTGGKKKKCANNNKAALVTGTSSHAGGCILCRLSHLLTRCSATHRGPCTLKYTNHFPVGRRCDIYLHGITLLSFQNWNGMQNRQLKIQPQDQDLQKAFKCSFSSPNGSS